MDALDQVSGAAQLAKRLSSVDSARVGIWGWVAFLLFHHV